MGLGRDLGRPRGRFTNCGYRVDFSLICAPLPLGRPCYQRTQAPTSEVWTKVYSAAKLQSKVHLPRLKVHLACLFGFSKLSLTHAYEGTTLVNQLSATAQVIALQNLCGRVWPAPKFDFLDSQVCGWLRWVYA